MTRNRNTAVLLALLMGGCGMQKFYVGRNAQGVLSLMFAGTFCPIIVGIIDAIRWLRMSDQAFARLYGPPGIPVSSSRDGSRVRGELVTVALVIWKVAYLMSWLIVPIFLYQCTPLSMVVSVAGGMGGVLLAAVVLRRAAGEIRNPYLAYLLDPIGAEARQRKSQPLPFERWLQLVRQNGGLGGAKANWKGSRRYISDAPDEEWNLHGDDHRAGSRWYGSADDDWRQNSSAQAAQAINPGSGLPTLDGAGGVDVGGFLWGEGPDDRWHRVEDDLREHQGWQWSGPSQIEFIDNDWHSSDPFKDHSWD